jgi:hypothetical protein
MLSAMLLHAYGRDAIRRGRRRSSAIAAAKRTPGRPYEAGFTSLTLRAPNRGAGDRQAHE